MQGDEIKNDDFSNKNQYGVDKNLYEEWFNVDENVQIMALTIKDEITGIILDRRK